MRTGMPAMRRTVGRSSSVLRPTILALVIVALLVVFGAQGVHAQSATMTLVVRCWTVVDTPVAGIAVTVRDAQTDAPLLQGATGANGTVRFRTITARPVRVVVQGTLGDGTTLRHTRQDRRGIWVTLPQRDWTMTLRVDTDGLVFPDLGAADAGALDAEAATAIAGGTLPTVGTANGTRAAPRATAIVSTAVAVADAVTPPTNASERAGIVVLVVLMATTLVVAWLLGRARS